MEINKNNTPHINTNFKGTFIINTQNQAVKKAIPDIVKKGRQIFYNIKNDGDIVIVTQDKYDKRVNDFINTNKVKFEYYPEISTKSGLDDQVPSKLKKLLGIKNYCVITDHKMLDKFFASGNIHLSKQSEFLQEALNTLRLNIEKLKIEINNKGTFVIRDEAKQRRIKSSGFRGGTAYIAVIPDSYTQETKRFLVGKNGKEVIKEYNTPKEIFSFNKIFNKIIKARLYDEV